MNFTEIKRINLILSIIVIFLFAFGSCSNDQLDHLGDENLLETNEQKLTIDSTYNEETYEHIFTYRINAEHYEKLIYDSVMFIKEKRTYKKGILDSVYQYNPGGKSLKGIKEYKEFMNSGEAQLNTYVYYGENDSINLKRSCLYKILNPQSSYSQNDEAKLKVELITGEINDKVRLISGDIDELFRYDLKKRKEHYPDNQTGVMEIPLPTEKKGKINYRFIIEEYTKLPSSIIQIHPILVEYTYAVK
jgi:hypothetical protein